MEKEQKAKLVIEIDRSEYDAYLFLMNQKKTDETEKVWEAMCMEPVSADTSVFDDNEQSVKLMLMSLAILSVEKKVKG